MADAIIPVPRAPELDPERPDTTSSAPSRDYTAEYARREAIAHREGFPSYWAKRKALSGHPIPARPRTRRVA